MLRLFTKTDYFFDYFEQSGQNIVDGTKLLQDMFDDHAKAKERSVAIKDLEHATDVVTHKTFKSLDSTFITPVDREDIHTLISTLDDVMDLVDSSANRFVLYQVESSTPGLKKMSAILHKSAIRVHGALGKFRNFKKNKATLLKELVEINTLENEGDEAMREALFNLFEHEKDFIRLIKLKEIYEQIEMAIDRCEDVSNVIETVILKHS